MANPRIEVEIGAVIDGLQQGFGQAVKIIDTLEKQAQDLERALREATDLETIEKLNVDLAKTRSALSQLRTTGIDPLTKATKDYNAVGVNFARLIQDAPFGIIGVSNNITALAESFGVAKSKGQTFTQALKGIFSSGNLLTLGISVLTSAFVVLQQKGFFKTEESATSLKDRLDEYQKSLEGVASATLKGSQDAQKEIASLRGLELQATNTALSQEKRLLAVDELQKQYPEYFGNLTEEQILNGQVGDAYIQVTQNLLAKAKAQASINQIAQNSIELLRIETKLEDEKSKRLLATADAQGQLDLLIAKRQKDGFLTQGDIDRYNELIRRINNANESLSEEKTLQGEIKRIKEENIKLEGEVNKQLQAGASLVNNRTKLVNKEQEAFEKFSKAWDEFNLSYFNNNVFSQSVVDIEKINKLLTESINKATKFIEISIPDTPPQQDVPQEDKSFKTRFQLGLKSLDEEFQAYSGNFIAKVTEFVSTVKNIIQQNMFEAFVGIGEAIGSAFAKGENILSAVGQSLLDTLSTFLGDLGRQLIAFGVAGTAFGTLLEAIKKGGPASIPAGIGAIAAGTALIAISSAIRNRAAAGPSGGGGVGTAGVGAGTSFTGGGLGFAFDPNREIRGELVARGSDLVYVFNEANNRINKG